MTILAFLCLLIHPRADAFEFPSAASLTLNDNAEASPYPSTVTVSGVSGIIGSVRVKLNGFSHTRPADLDIFLVAPNGQTAAVMSDAGGEVEATALNLVFDDTAATAIPATGPLTSGTFQPANHEPGEPPPPGATLPSDSKFTVMANGGVNGPWKLYVRDDQTGETGTLTSWALEIETTNALNASYTTGAEVPLTTEGFTATGKTVNFTLNYAPTRGANLTVVNNTGLDFIQGTFEGIPNGAAVDLTFAGIIFHFIAWYYGGNGNDFVLLWRDTGIAAWGFNDSGQLGTNTSARHTTPTSVIPGGVLAGKTIVATAAGGAHSLALCSDGTLTAWGDNAQGQLGDNTTTSRRVPGVVNQNGILAGKTVIAIAAGGAHSLALCSDGTLTAWGSNYYGALGDNSTVNRTEPVAVDQSGVLAGKTVVALAAGWHSLVLCSDGTVAAWGWNDSGQLGDGTTSDRTVPVAVRQTGVLAGKTVMAIAAGQFHSQVLCSDGTLAA